jgi:hypothetical protein
MSMPAATFGNSPVKWLLVPGREEPNESLHCLVLDGVYRRTEDGPIFDEARATAVMSCRACSTRSSRV